MTAIAYPDRLHAAGRLGHTINDKASAAEALAACGLDWEVATVPTAECTITGPDGTVYTEDGHNDKAFVVRTDTNTRLAEVGKRWHPVQNAAAFSVVDHIPGTTLGHGGSYNGGRNTYLSLNIDGGDVKIGGQDALKFSILVTNSHDSTSSWTASVRATRLACTNGMHAPIRGLSNTLRVRHTRNAEGLVKQGLQIFRDTQRYIKEFTALADQLIGAPMSEAEFEAYLQQMMPAPERATVTKADGTTHKSPAMTRWEGQRDALYGLWRMAPTTEEGRGSRWAAYNALTEWMDWERPARANGRDAVQHRAEQQLRDADGAARARALNLLLV